MKIAARTLNASRRPPAPLASVAPVDDDAATNEVSLTIAEVAARTGITAHTLRYYERIGLIAAVGRAGSGHRRYGNADLRWLSFLQKLSATGMPIRGMLAYAELVRRGESTLAERRAMLEAHRDQVKKKLREQQGHLEIIERKVAMYGDLERAGGSSTP